MTGKRIIYTRADGMISVIMPAPNYLAGCAKEDEALAAIMAKRVPPEAKDVMIINAAEMPVDRTFREAWEVHGGRLSVNMDKARVIHMRRIRGARDGKLLELDVGTIKAVGADNDVKRDHIEVEKQKLRDIPQTFDLSAARTPQELKALWPTEL